MKVRGYLENLHFSNLQGTPIARKAIKGISADIAMISVAEKGFLNLQLRVQSTGGHSSMPPENGTVITHLAQALVALNNNPPPVTVIPRSPILDMLEQLHRHAESAILRFVLKNIRSLVRIPGFMLLLFRFAPTLRPFFETTQMATLIQGGSAVNVIPGEARASINYRIAPGTTVDDIVSHVSNVLEKKQLMNPKQRFYSRAFHGGKVVFDHVSKMDGFNPSPISSFQHASFELIANIVHVIHPNAAIVPSLMIAGIHHLPKKSHFSSSFFFSSDRYRHETLYRSV
jgi:carboxypeptidase PM20D1